LWGIQDDINILISLLSILQLLCLYSIPFFRIKPLVPVCGLQIDVRGCLSSSLCVQVDANKRELERDINLVRESTPDEEEEDVEEQPMEVSILFQRHFILPLLRCRCLACSKQSRHECNVPARIMFSEEVRPPSGEPVSYG